MNELLSIGLFMFFLMLSSNSCTANRIDESVKALPVLSEHFITDNLIGKIEHKTVRLRGTETLCYVIRSKAQPTEHTMGPWCPKHIQDEKESVGIWFKDGKVYDVSGHFITNLDEFYADHNWKLYREDG